MKRDIRNICCYLAVCFCIALIFSCSFAYAQDCELAKICLVHHFPYLENRKITIIGRFDKITTNHLQGAMFELKKNVSKKNVRSFAEKISNDTNKIVEPLNCTDPSFKYVTWQEADDSWQSHHTYFSPNYIVYDPITGDASVTDSMKVILEKKERIELDSVNNYNSNYFYYSISKPVIIGEFALVAFSRNLGDRRYGTAATYLMKREKKNWRIVKLLDVSVF